MVNFNYVYAKIIPTVPRYRGKWQLGDDLGVILLYSQPEGDLFNVSCSIRLLGRNTVTKANLLL